MSNNTHMGQPASQHVLLEVMQVANTGDNMRDMDFFRILPDGTSTPSGGSGFRTPPGKILIITDVDWHYDGGSAGGVQTLYILIKLLTDPMPMSGRKVFESTILLNGEGHGGTSEAMTNGFVVSSQVRLAVGISPGGEGKIQHVLLRGYLAPDK
jgi:hypothetical protein